MPAKNETAEPGRDRKEPHARSSALSRWFDPTAFAELTLVQLLEDPLVRLLMSSDGVDPAQVRALFATMAKPVDVSPAGACAAGRGSD